MLGVGLSSEDKVALSNRYEVPFVLTPPAINPEIFAIMPPIDKKRDDCYINIQSQLAQGLSAVGDTLNQLLNKDENIPKQSQEKLLSPLWDAGRIFTNLFYNITQTRRS